MIEKNTRIYNIKDYKDIDEKYIKYDSHKKKKMKNYMIKSLKKKMIILFQL